MNNENNPVSIENAAESSPVKAKYTTGTKIIFGVIMTLLALCIAGAGAVALFGADFVSGAARKEYSALAAQVHTGPATVDFAALSEQNPDTRAWLLCEGTGIDYPVVQGDSGDYYRTHLFSGTKSSFGCLYTTTPADRFLSAKNTVIYGSRQLDSIYKYARQDYYDLMPSVTVSTPEGARTVLLYAGVYADNAAELIVTDFADSAAFENYLAQLGELSVFRSGAVPTPSDNLVTICVLEDSGEGFVLVGILR